METTTNSITIEEISVVNWKCFDSKKEKFTNRNIINRPNGTGKSSIFQAIIFGLFGKMPAGFNLNTLRKNQDEVCKVLVKFEYEGDKYESYRQFGGSSYVAVKKNGNTVSTSSKEAFAYVNAILPYNIMSVLWAPNTLSTSHILKPNFLVDHLLDYIFEDPKFLLSHYKYELFGQNKLIKNIEGRLLDVKNLKEAIESKEAESVKLKDRLKEKSNFSDREANRASVSKEAHIELEKGSWENILDRDLVNSYRSVVGRNDPVKVGKDLQERLEREESKKNSPLLSVQLGSLRKIKEVSEKDGKCLVCESEWKEQAGERIQKVIDNPESRNQGLIDSLKEKIKVLEISHELVEKTMQFLKLKENLSLCENWKEVLDKHDKENDKLWEDLERIQNQIEQLRKQEEVQKSYTKEKEEAKKISRRVDLISSYIREASAYYSRALTEEASKILSSLNSRYDQIFLDEGEYRISVISEDMKSIDLIPAVQLSSGEKTLVGISLILSAHKLFFGHAPLLFDESFSALDRENINELKKLFSSNSYQTFIITHDTTWEE